MNHGYSYRWRGKNLQEEQMKTYHRRMGCLSRKGQKKVCEMEGLGADQFLSEK